MNLIANCFKLLLIYFAGAPNAAPQSWNCSTGTGFCILISEERRSWHDASNHCFQRRGGLAHSDHFELILHSSIWFSSEMLVWTGLGWVDGRLQWMSHIPHEETNVNVFTSYARRRVDPAKLCYFMNRNGIVTEGFCKQQLHYICIMPGLVRMPFLGEEFQEVKTASVGAFVPELIPSGKFKTHSQFLVVEPSADMYFDLFCNVPTNTNCSSTRYRWLKNGAYQPEVDGNMRISDSGEISLERRASWILNWLGKIACEVFCSSSGKAYRSKEAILVLRESVSLRVEFQLSSVIDFFVIQHFFEEVIHSKLRNRIRTISEVPHFQIDLPLFLSYPESSTNSFSFYAHVANMDPQGTLRLNMFLRIISLLSPNNYWIDSYDKGRYDFKGLFKNISVVMLNYCLEGDDSPNLVFANQVTLARGFNSRFRDETVDNSSCLYASQQCKSDWFNPASFKSFTLPLDCLNCMAPFQDYKERCLRIIRPMPFSRSIAQCMAEYKNDQVDDIWNLSDWIKISLDWVDANKELSENAALNLNLLWLPIQRRTALGPLRPVWPWNDTDANAVSSLNENSWTETIFPSLRRIPTDWSKLNASLPCLALNTETKIFQSVSCKTNLPMVCVRPRMKSTDSGNSNMNFSIGGQCPVSWRTSSLIAERNHCYKIFYGEVTYTVDEAKTECEKYGGQMAVAAQPSTLAVILNIFKAELVEISHLWIGLKKTSKGFQWMDQSSWTYEHRIEWAEDKWNRDRGNYDRNSYGVSLTAIPGLSNGIQEFSSLKWKMWPKEARLNGFICQKVIFPQPEATLQMHLDISYRPLVTAKRVPLLVREVNTADTPKDFLLKDYELKSATNNEPLFISRLSCFVDNSNFIEDYESGDAMINYNVIETKVPGIMEWRAAEIRCETWDEWSPETIRASWIISGDPNGNASFSSLIVWLRHRTVNYSSEIHDSTFKASSSQREVFKRSLHDMFVQEFVKLYPLYTDSLLSASEPVAFESEPFPNQQLLVKYRILLNLNPLTGKKDGRGNPWSPDDQATIMEDVRKFFSEKFNSSSNVRPPGTDLDFLSVRSTDFCHGEITSTNGEFLEFSRQPRDSMTTLSWPKSTMGSRVASAPYCVTRDGLMLRRRCLGDRSSGLYWESLDSIKSGGSLCVETSPLFKQLFASMIMENSSQILQEIRHHITDWNPGIAEMDLLAQSLSRSVHYIKRDLNEEDLLNLEIIIQQINNLNIDTLIRAQHSSSFSSNLTGAIENLFSRINTNKDKKPFDRGTSQRLRVEFPYMAAGSWDRLNKNETIMGFTITTKDNAIIKSTVLTSTESYADIQDSNVAAFLPFQQFDTGKEQITFTACPDTRLVDASAASGKFSSPIFAYDLSQPDGWSRSEDLYTGNGGMVQVRLNPAPPRLHKPIKILFRPKFKTTEEDKHLLRCVFWSEQMDSGNGGWSTDGCWYEGADQNGMAICVCNHLSTFTLLVCRSEKELQSTVHGGILNIITVIGSLASVLGLSLILATFVFFPSWRKPLGHKILFQLSVALMCLLLTFFGVDSIDNVNTCRFVAIFLHYFLLSCFCWMTVEAYYQYRRLVIVFGAYVPNFLLKASIVAWGFPIIPVASVLIYDVDSYTGSEGYCWLSDPTAFFSTVLGPLVFLMLINLAIFFLVVRSIIAAGRGLRTNQSESKQIREKLLASFLNFVLLGLTWIFGFFAIGATNAVIFSYLFCVTSSLQGFIIFILYVGRDPSARKHWLMCFGVIALKSRNWSNILQAKSPDSKSGNSAFYYDVTSESGLTTTTENCPSSPLRTSVSDVQYVMAVPWSIEVREAQRQPTKNAN